MNEHDRLLGAAQPIPDPVPALAWFEVIRIIDTSGVGPLLHVDCVRSSTTRRVMLYMNCITYQARNMIQSGLIPNGLYAVTAVGETIVNIERAGQ
jgi:hypothetical protein